MVEFIGRRPPVLPLVGAHDPREVTRDRNGPTIGTHGLLQPHLDPWQVLARRDHECSARAEARHGVELERSPALRGPTLGDVEVREQRLDVHGKLLSGNLVRSLHVIGAVGFDEFPAMLAQRCHRVHGLDECGVDRNATVSIDRRESDFVDVEVRPADAQVSPALEREAHRSLTRDQATVEPKLRPACGPGERDVVPAIRVQRARFRAKMGHVTTAGAIGRDDREAEASARVATQLDEPMLTEVEFEDRAFAPFARGPARQDPAFDRAPARIEPRRTTREHQVGGVGGSQSAACAPAVDRPRRSLDEVDVGRVFGTSVGGE